MLSHRPSAKVPLALPATGLSLKSMVLEGDRADTREVRRLRPVATADGGMAAALTDLQRALAPQAEAALLRRLDRPGKPPKPVLERLWDWASPDEGGRTQLDTLARDRCALACALWMASGEAVLRALERGDGALVQVLRELHGRALQGARDRATAYPDARTVDARLQATEAWLQRIEAPARSRLGALLLAWSAPASLTTPQLMRALADGDAVARAHAPGEDNVWLGTLRCFVRSVGRPGAAALLRQVAPVFLQAACALGTLPTPGEFETASGLLHRLDELGRLPEDEARALARDTRRLPWSTDPPLVRVHCILACLQLSGAARSGAMDLVCARAPRLALQRAAGGAGAEHNANLQQLATLRRATLYAAFSVRVGQLARGDDPLAAEGSPVDRLRNAEFADLAPTPTLHEEINKVVAGSITPERMAGLRVLNVWLATQSQLPAVSTMAVLAACARPQPLDGCAMVALLDACGQVTLGGRAAARAEQLRANVVVRLLMAPMPANIFRLGPVLYGLLGEHVCREHAPPSYVSATTCIEFIDAMLARADTDAERSTLCLAVSEAIDGLSCRLEAALVATAVAKLDPGAWTTLLLRLLDDGAYAARDVGERLRLVDEVAEEAGAEAASSNEGRVGRPLVRVSETWRAARTAIGHAVEAAFAADAAAASAHELQKSTSRRSAAQAMSLLREAASVAGEARAQLNSVAHICAQHAPPPANAAAAEGLAPAPVVAAAEAGDTRPPALARGAFDDAEFAKQKAARLTSAPGPFAFAWRVGAGEHEDVALLGESVGGPRARLRHALQRELDAADVDALCLVVEDCAARLQGWMATFGHSGADHALLPGELDTLDAAAATLERWRTRAAPRRVSNAALRLGAALVFRALGPPPQRPYWASDDGRTRHYRALFAVMAGVRGSTAPRRAQLELRLARQHFTARRAAAFGFAEV